MAVAIAGLLGAMTWITPTLAVDSSPFDSLLGGWGGSGSFQLDDGRRERIACNVYYTGGGSQLRMAVRCSGQTNNIEIRSKLQLSGGSISGTWEERTYNAQGSASGSVTSGRISLDIAGGVSGQMDVTLGRSRHSVAITTQGLPLRRVDISLSRR